MLAPLIRTVLFYSVADLSEADTIRYTNKSYPEICKIVDVAEERETHPAAVSVKHEEGVDTS